MKSLLTLCLAFFGALALLATSMIGASKAQTQSATVTLPSLNETDVDERYPATNYAAASTLRVDGDTGGGKDRYSLIRFDLSRLPAGAKVTSARLWADISDTATQVYPMYALNRGWVETQTTWQRYGGGTWQIPGAKGALDRGTTTLGTFWGKGAGAQYSTLAPAGVQKVQSWVDRTARNDGLIIASTANYDSLAFARPRLEVTYTPPSKPIAGVYGGYQNSANVDSFYSWLGYPGEKYAHEFIGHEPTDGGWPTIGNCMWDGWATWVSQNNANRRLTMSLPMLPEASRGDFAGITQHKYDSYFAACADNLERGGGTADTIIRLGWEANGNTFPWRIDLDGGPGSATQAEVDDYKAAYRHIVGVMKQANPSLKFEWEMNVTLDDAGRPLEELYPGDAYVDYVGLAVYDYCISGCTSNTVDGRWNNLVEPPPVGGANNGLRHHAQFAASRGKPISFTEYGLWPVARPPGGGGDNEIFIRRLADWMRQKGAAYHIYNEAHSDHTLLNSSQYLKGRAEYKTQFGTS